MKTTNYLEGGLWFLFLDRKLFVGKDVCELFVRLPIKFPGSLLL
jgi:hypothetical protein